MKISEQQSNLEKVTTNEFKGHTKIGSELNLAHRIISLFLLCKIIPMQKIFHLHSKKYT